MKLSKESRMLDVRPILAKGGEPLGVIRARVDEMVAGQTLTVVAPFLPAPLIERLRGEGFSAGVEHRADGAWEVSFRKS